MLKLPAGGSRLPASRETVENKLHYIQMNGREVFKFAVRVMSEVTEEVLSAGGLGKNDLDFFIPHQANIRMFIQIVLGVEQLQQHVAIQMVDGVEDHDPLVFLENLALHVISFGAGHLVIGIGSPVLGDAIGRMVWMLIA